MFMNVWFRTRQEPAQNGQKGSKMENFISFWKFSSKMKTEHHPVTSQMKLFSPCFRLLQFQLFLKGLWFSNWLWIKSENVSVLRLFLYIWKRKYVCANSWKCFSYHSIDMIHQIFILKSNKCFVLSAESFILVTSLIKVGSYLEKPNDQSMLQRCSDFRSFVPFFSILK